MNTRETVPEKLAITAGSCMFFFGILMLGPLGFLLLLGLFYAMLVQNFALGLVTVFLLCTPAIFGIIWAALAWTAVIAESIARVPESAVVVVARIDD